MSNPWEDDWRPLKDLERQYASWKRVRYLKVKLIVLEQ